MPAPPEAKLTPVIGIASLLLLDTKERYGGGDATKPAFSAACQTVQTSTYGNIMNLYNIFTEAGPDIRSGIRKLKKRSSILTQV